MLDAVTGKITTVATKENHFGGITVSPDDAYMIYPDGAFGGSDLMLVKNFR